MQTAIQKILFTLAAISTLSASTTFGAQSRGSTDAQAASGLPIGCSIDKIVNWLKQANVQKNINYIDFNDPSPKGQRENDQREAQFYHSLSITKLDSQFFRDHSFQIVEDGAPDRFKQNGYVITATATTSKPNEFKNVTSDATIHVIANENSCYLAMSLEHPF